MIPLTLMPVKNYSSIAAERFRCVVNDRFDRLRKEILDKEITIGIIGGGQLARMSAQAAQRMGHHVVILDSDPDCPAAQVAPDRIQLDWNSEGGTIDLAKRSSVITLENEWASPRNLLLAERLGASVIPEPKTLAIIGDKYEQRRTFGLHNLPSPQFRALTNWRELEEAAHEWGGAIVLKSRRGGYDGYGVKVLKSPSDWLNLPDTDAALWYAEEYVPFDVELAVMVSKNACGQTSVYPVVESRQTRDGNRCDIVIAPAPGLSKQQTESARRIALAAVEAVGGAGLYGVELFQVGERIMINEIAPRPHNSGHYTMDGCLTSQFEQHIRTVRNLPPGPTDLLAPCVVMANLLAPTDGSMNLSRAIEFALAVCPETHIHWYGKSEMRTGRKMGHLNLLGADTDITLSRALEAREAFWKGSL